MGYPDSRICLVNMLAASTAGPVCLDFKILWFYLNLYILLNLRHYIHRSKGSMPSARSIKRRNPHHTVDTPFPFQITIGIIPFNQECYTLDSCFITGLKIKGTYLITIAFRPTGIHPQEYLSSILGLCSSSSRMNGQNGIKGIIFAT